MGPDPFLKVRIRLEGEIPGQECRTGSTAGHDVTEFEQMGWKSGQDERGKAPGRECRTGKTAGPKRGRTADLYTASVALYQLSYRPVFEA